VHRKGRRSQCRAVSREFRAPTPLKSTDLQCGHRANTILYSTSITSELTSSNNPNRESTPSENFDQILRTSAGFGVSTALPSRRADFKFEPGLALVRSVPLCERFPHQTEDRRPVLHNHFQPAPHAFRWKIDAPEEDPRDEMTDLVGDGLICDRLDCSCCFGWVIRLRPGSPDFRLDFGDGCPASTISSH